MRKLSLLLVSLFVFLIGHSSAQAVSLTKVTWRVWVQVEQQYVWFESDSASYWETCNDGDADYCYKYTAYFCDDYDPDEGDAFKFYFSDVSNTFVSAKMYRDMATPQTDVYSSNTWYRGTRTLISSVGVDIDWNYSYSSAHLIGYLMTETVYNEIVKTKVYVMKISC